MYTTGVLSNFYKPKNPVLEGLTDDCPKELCLSKTRIPHEYCKKLGLLPKRDDFECDYDNYAEVPIARVRCDLLGDELYRGLALACIDMYTERLRRRQLRHMLLANLNLLTHILPKLLPDVGSAAKATIGCHGGAQARTALDQWRRNYGGAGDKSATRKYQHVNVGRRRFGRSVTAPQSTSMKSSSCTLLEESAAKTCPPSSVESFHDSGVGYSESPMHSVASVETSGAPNSSPVEDIGGNSGDSTPVPPPIIGRPPQSTLPLEDEVCHLVSNTPKKCGSPQNVSTLYTKPKNPLIFESISTVPPDKCCIPPYIADPLKPLLRFLSASEAKSLLNQLHKEHILRQEIEQLEQLKQSQSVFLNGTRLAGSTKSPPKADESDDSASEEAGHKFPSQGGASTLTLSKRRRLCLFTSTKRAKQQCETCSPPAVNHQQHRLGLRSRRISRSFSKSSTPVRGGTRRRGRPPLHHHGHRQHHQRLLIRT
ncbi:hypothetical protein Aperf_G00000037472 [Anoplocephala perfoliata]